MESLFETAAHCLTTCETEEKLRLAGQTAQAWRDGLLSLDYKDEPEPIGEPGHPDRPVLVAPDKVAKRGLGTIEGLSALVHAMTHIEFNAINLAWDAVYRFRDLPEQYYSDWIKVAEEEAYHFQLLRTRLNELGTDYGEFTAHNGLWDMAKRTAFDPMVRMALVPRVLEARGLDVTPGIIKRLRHAGDEKTVAVLEIILHDEVEHVAIGSRWFKYFCQQRGLDSEQTFRELISQYFTRPMSGPFDYAARQKAGFTITELKALECMEISAENCGKTPSNSS
ncbi:MAG: ferritin-like domain-containing protein [Nitrosomonas sp.]|uniref:ferritin-like domain-containing protein n=1 Tax=Nitrosomonas sp. TaxID=42353 RepID=UPI0027344890|nr:ferritin-like domain-containing protein [Nitrosomonas sp.]MDP3664217.1 ferritin-like domain-containing protein [Nitrosomonas sp.]MDZ4106015.1 ferritin-like domain-containing protein [Nitrosomonas sp.]